MFHQVCPLPPDRDSTLVECQPHLWPFCTEPPKKKRKRNLHAQAVATTSKYFSPPSSPADVSEERRLRRRFKRKAGSCKDLLGLKPIKIVYPPRGALVLVISVDVHMTDEFVPHRCSRSRDDLLLPSQLIRSGGNLAGKPHPSCFGRTLVLTRVIRSWVIRLSCSRSSRRRWICSRRGKFERSDAMLSSLRLFRALFVPMLSLISIVLPLYLSQSPNSGIIYRSLARGCQKYRIITTTPTPPNLDGLLMMGHQARFFPSSSRPTMSFSLPQPAYVLLGTFLLWRLLKNVVLARTRNVSLP